MTTLLTCSVPREYYYAAFSSFFLRLLVLSVRACLVFIGRGHVQPHVPLREQKGDSGGFRLRTDRECRGEMHTRRRGPTALSEEDSSFAHSFSFTSPYFLLWPRKFHFLSSSFWTPLPFASLLGITSYSLKWWWDYIRDIKGNGFDSCKQR